MKILLIGHEGYLGRGLHAYFKRCHGVVGWDRKEDLFKLDASYLAREKIDTVVNLAVMAERTSAAYRIGDPTDVVNAMGARHIAEILRGSDIAWIQMSTRETLGPVYGPKDVIKTKAGLRPKFFVDESQAYAPLNFYAKSKIMAEFISESHPRSAIIRLSTCYTDYDYPGGSWVILLIRSVVKGGPVKLTRGGLQFRDPLHVDDLGRLIESVCERQVFGQRIHAGGGRMNLISLKEFVRMADPRVKIERAPGGDYGFAFDIRKATRLTGWTPQILVRDRIPVIVENIRRGVSWPPA